MRDALLQDLSQLDNVHVMTTYDERLPVPINVEQSQVVNKTDDVWEIWQEAIEQVDYVWWIAPETDQILLSLTENTLAMGIPVIGCGVNAIKISSSKWHTAQFLQYHQVETIPTSYYAEWRDSLGAELGVESGFDSWVVKPNDGAGSENTYCFENNTTLIAWFNDDKTRKNQYVIQPYIKSESASLCLLVQGEQVTLLSCNRQLIYIQNGEFRYLGTEVNGLQRYHVLCEEVVRKIQLAMPGLQAYVGVDVLIDAANQKVKVVDINPRITTSYIGLSEATGCNAAALILDSVLNEGENKVPDIAHNKVMIHVKA